MLTRLVDLAREPSSERRRELLGKLADLFLADAANYEDQTVLHFNDILGRLLDEADIRTRAGFAARAAASPRLSADLSARLARDEIEVAEPVLKLSDAIAEADLRDIAETRGNGHLEAIAQRRAVPASVTDVLVDRGDAVVVRTLAANPGAAFSGRGFDALADRSRADAELGELLCLRADLPKETAERVATGLPEHVRQRLALLLETDEAAATTVLETVARLTRDERLERKARRLAIRGRIASVKAGRDSLDELIIGLSLEDAALDLALVLAETASVEEKVAQSCLHRVEDEPLAVLLHSIGVTAAAVDAIALMRCRKLNLPDSMRRHLVETWRGVDRQASERVMRFVRLRANIQRQ